MLTQASHGLQVLCRSIQLLAPLARGDAAKTGRPPLDQEVQQLIVRLAKENPRWSYQRIRL